MWTLVETIAALLHAASHHSSPACPQICSTLDEWMRIVVVRSCHRKWNGLLEVRLTIAIDWYGDTI